MNKPPDPTLLDVLYRAKNSQRGIVVTTNSVERLRPKLYALKKEHPDLADLILKPDPVEKDTRLFIIRKNPDGPE